MGAVFYFYSNQANHQEKLKEKYTVIRLARQFVDNVINDASNRYGESGSEETEGFILEWKRYPAEDRRDIVLSSGLPPQTQLHLVHLQVFKKETGNNVLELHFLRNRITSSRKRFHAPPGIGK